MRSVMGVLSHVDGVAKNLVNNWASSALHDGGVSSAARECFEGATAIRCSAQPAWRWLS